VEAVENRECKVVKARPVTKDNKVSAAKWEHQDHREAVDVMEIEVKMVQPDLLVHVEQLERGDQVD